MTTAVLSYEDCIGLTAGQHHAAAILHRATKLFHYANVIRRGRAWIVRPRTDWMDDLQLTAKQWRNAIVFLRENGLVETAQMPWVKAGRLRNILFLRPSEEARANPRFALQGQPKKQDEDKFDVLEEKSNPAANAACEQQPPEIQKIVSKEETRSGWGDTPNRSWIVMNVVETMQKIASMKAKRVDMLRPESSGALIAAFREGCIANKTPHTGSFTMKQLGQFKMLNKALPNASVYLHYTVSHWSQFKSFSGDRNVPVVPHLGYLLAVRDVMVAFVNAARETKAKMDNHSAVVPVTAPLKKLKTQEEKFDDWMIAEVLRAYKGNEAQGVKDLECEHLLERILSARAALAINCTKESA